ncbi:hypothetical protein MNBD_BACTEROID01-987 [hydrothermal vent metagenome]|uniref:DUF362 domain-containing protein n=1 Tax=hydrothermal vent metagenome TaxID=652676 RepID=A0A3B0TBC5_9ZZZZ
MDRRDFIKSGLKAGVATGIAASFGSSAIAAKLSANNNFVFVKGGLPDEMFDTGIAILGGIERFVSKGDNVAIKPDMSTDSYPEQGKTTHPLLVKQIIKSCYEAGARKVLVFDHTYGLWTKCYKDSGIERIAKDAYARVLPANNQRYYSEQQSTKPDKLRSVKIHNALIQADTFINVPILKYDPATKISASLKNLMGCVWDREFYKKNGLDQCIAEFLYYKKPQLTILDAYFTSSGNRKIKSQIITTDIVAADAFGARLLGFTPDNIGHIMKAAQLGFGKITAGNMNVKPVDIG